MTNISVYHPSFGRYVQFMRAGSVAVLEAEATVTTASDDALLEADLEAD